MKSVLIVAYDFPPMRSSGIYRPLKFARYLRDFGWRPVILSVANPPPGPKDDRLLQQLPSDTPIYRATSYELKRLERRVFDFLFRRQESPSAGKPTAEHANEASQQSARLSPLAWLKRGLLSPLSRYTHGVLYTPDDRIGWLPMATRLGLNVIEREKIDAIIATSPPETAQLVGLELANETGLPFLCDFRDPWTDNWTRSTYSEERMARERRLEEAVLRRADRIIAVGPGMSRMYEDSFPWVPRHKLVVIENGYDENDFTDLTARWTDDGTDRLNLVNIGTIYDPSTFTPFFDVFRELIASPDYRERIKLTFVGNIDAAIEAQLRDPSLGDTVEVVGFVPHAEAAVRMATADALLMTLPTSGSRGTQDRILPGKLFEYLRVGRPVLFCGWPGDAATVLEEARTGRLVVPEDPGAIRQALIDLIEMKRNRQLAIQPNREVIARFDRRAQTGRLAKELDAVDRRYRERRPVPTV